MKKIILYVSRTANLSASSGGNPEKIIKHKTTVFNTTLVVLIVVVDLKNGGWKP